MPRPCSVCARPDRHEIDTLLCEGLPIRDVSGRTGVPKSSLARHKLAHLPGALVVTVEQEIARTHDLFTEARALQRSMNGWAAARDREGWLAISEQADDDYESGKFLLTRLGAERHLDPEQVATLLRLRCRIIAEMNLTTAVELMLLDTAIIAYRNMLMVEEWIGNLALLAEHHMFADDGPTAKISKTNGRYQGLVAEDDAKRLRDQLLPAQERATKTFLTAIKALREYQGGGVHVTVGSAGQVNLAEQQLVVGPHMPPTAKAQPDGDAHRRDHLRHRHVGTLRLPHGWSSPYGGR